MMTFFGPKLAAGVQEQNDHNFRETCNDEQTQRVHLNRASGGNRNHRNTNGNTDALTDASQGASEGSNVQGQSAPVWLGPGDVFR